jgi:uncharacterized protein YheU (UPF0270 family)
MNADDHHSPPAVLTIDPLRLEPETLENVLGEIVLRAGSEYGEGELSFDDKKAQLRHALDTGKAVLVFYPGDGFCDVVKV